ncbi:MAG: hypothetical protein Q4G06_10425 [Clostridia bacterium]|nr:hypothetical protein [Clostridia bacterium]
MPVHETPRTIEELRAWYVAHHLPPEDVTRFFIGKDVREPRAFGVYRDGDCFVVYKNKDDGSRAVRYHGPDEGYAVNELYLRLKQEIENQKGRNGEKREVNKKKERRNMIICISIFVAVVVILLFLDSFNPDDGYYNYHNRWYYYGSSNWYVYEDDWVPYNADAELKDNYEDYYVGETYSDDYVVPDFALTEYYSTTDSDSDWDSSSSWDFGSTDWSSDW